VTLSVEVNEMVLLQEVYYIGTVYITTKSKVALRLVIICGC
jgi:hypothetical protein